MKRALCVGLNIFPNFPQDTLQMCVNDATFYQGVFKNLGVDPKNLILLLNDAPKAKYLQSLSWLVAASQPGDILFWATSGHGTPWVDKQGMTHEAIVCSDVAETPEGDWDLNTLLTGPEVGAILSKMPKNSHVEAFWDCCFSGLGMKAFRKKSKCLTNAAHLAAGSTPSADRQMIDDIPCEVILWEACSGNQTAADAPNLGNGAFTWAWKKNYIAKPKQTRTDLIAHTRMDLRTAGFEQNPHLECDSKPAFERVGQ